MGKAEDTADAKANWHWRNTMRPVRFFGLDARAAIPFIILLFHFRLYTLTITIAITVVFIMLERRGLYFTAAIRTFRTWFLGQRRPAWLSVRRKRMVDYG